MTNHYAVVGATHTNMYKYCYKFVVIPNSYIISKIGMRMPYVLRKKIILKMYLIDKEEVTL